MANQQWAGESTCQLSLSQTSTSNYTSVYSSSPPVTIYGGIKVYVITSNQTFALISSSTPVAIGSQLFTSSSSGVHYFQGAWVHDATAASGVGIKIEVYMDWDNPPTTLQATFKTENMTQFYGITDNTWTVTYYLDASYTSPDVTIHFGFGNTEYNSRIDGFEASSQPIITPPSISDFYINNTWAGSDTQFSFNVTDNVALDHALFGCNATQAFVNDSSIPLVGTQAWANVTHTLPSYNCEVSFQLWLWNSNGSMSTTELRYVKVYTYNNASGAWNTPFISLSQAIQAIDSANNWASVETYARTILAKKTTTDLANMIDSYASSGDWIDVLEWSAVCNKLGIARQNAIIDALGNFTMLGSLPQEGTDPWGKPCFDTRYRAVLYGYYWAAQYNVSLAKWNITAAYNQFNSSIYNLGKPALWIYADGTAYSYSDRYYDEGACTVDCYTIFAELLNVSRALNDASHWWSAVDSMHWSSTGQFYKYTPYSNIYECEAPFFLKIISILKYRYPSLANWNRVLIDIGNRFLSSEWASPQWGGANVVIHANPSNFQRRLENTFGAWQALLGTYMQLNSAYQSNMKDMLYGNNATEPAWALLVGSQAQQGRGGLFDYPNDLFVWGTSQPDDNNATAYGEILLFLMGIVPENTTIAFPLEELKYEYIQDIDPQMFQFDLRTQTTTIPVGAAGNITFQYGISPVTYVFNQSGIWQITFSNSWNMITNVTYVSALPTNRIYFMQISTPTPAYDVTISAHCITESADIDVQIAMDGSPTGYSTPHTFTGLTVTNTFSVPDADPSGHPFKQWSTGGTGRTITVTSGGTYTAYYQAEYSLNITTTVGGITNPAPGTYVYLSGTVANVAATPNAGCILDYWELDGVNIGSTDPTSVTMDSNHDLRAVFIYSIISIAINAHCITEGADVSVSIAMDGSPTGYSTPHTFPGLAGTHTFTVLGNDANGDPFKQWSTGSNSTTITVSSGGTYTAYYGTPTVRSVAVTDVGLYKTIVGQGSSLNVTVEVLDPGDYPEAFNVTLYANTTEIGTLETTLSSGNSAIITFVWNTTGIDRGTYIMSAYAWPVLGETDTSDNNSTGGSVIVAMVGDITGPNGWPDGKVDIKDISCVARRFGRKVPPGPAECDVTSTMPGVPDGLIDIRDLSLVAKNFGQYHP